MGKKLDNIKYNIVYAVLKSFALLPLWLLYPLSSFAAWVLCYVVRYRKKIIEKNMREVFPDASDDEIKGWKRSFYGHLCDIFVEAVKLLGMSDRQARRRIKVHNAEIIDRAINSGKSVVLFLGHYGNWEWVPSIVLHFNNPAILGQIYHPLRSKIFDRIMLKIRSRFGSESITMANTYRRLCEIERSGRKFVVGFISDQRPTKESSYKHWTEFMGIETDYIIGGEVIGDRLLCEYVYLDVEPRKRGHYDLTFRVIEPSADDSMPFPVTRQYLRLLETSIRRNPPYWLWSHNRFSHRRK